MIKMMIVIRACMFKRTRKKKSTKGISRLLEREVKRLWNGIEVVLIPIVIDALRKTGVLKKNMTCKLKLQNKGLY